MNDGGTMSRIAVALLMSVVGAGCMHVSTREINPAPHPLLARPPQTVEVITMGPPARPFVEVALIETQRRSVFNGDTFAALREAAAERGCDAVVVLGSNDRVIGDRHVTGTQEGYRGTCIAWLDGAPGPSASAAPPPPWPR
jgi:hypothetical protein